MKRLSKFILTFVSAVALILTSTSISFAKVVGDKIILGAAVSLTGKYSSNGVHTQNGYNLAVERINSMGGVKVGGKNYKFEIIYYDDESNSGRAAQLAERLIKQDKVQYMLGPYSSGLTKAIAPVTEENMEYQWLKPMVPQGHYLQKGTNICLQCFHQQTYILDVAITFSG